MPRRRGQGPKRHGRIDCRFRPVPARRTNFLVFVGTRSEAAAEAATAQGSRAIGHAGRKGFNGTHPKGQAAVGRKLLATIAPDGGGCSEKRQADKAEGASYGALEVGVRGKPREAPTKKAAATDSKI